MYYCVLVLYMHVKVKLQISLKLIANANAKHGIFFDFYFRKSTKSGEKLKFIRKKSLFIFQHHHFLQEFASLLLHLLCHEFALLKKRRSISRSARKKAFLWRVYSGKKVKKKTKNQFTMSLGSL